MQIQYTDLIQDHDEIAVAAKSLLELSFDQSSSADDILSSLHELAIQVRDHLAIEAPLVELLDNGKLTGPWLAAWQEGRPAYLSLVKDWHEFIDDWDIATIEGDRQTFLRATDDIVSRLEDRVMMESKTLYALSLQSGAVQFHLR